MEDDFRDCEYCEIYVTFSISYLNMKRCYFCKKMYSGLSHTVVGMLCIMQLAELLRSAAEWKCTIGHLKGRFRTPVRKVFSYR